MPKNLETGELTCINNCGPITRKDMPVDEFDGFALLALTKDKGGHGRTIHADKGFTLFVYSCDVCGYIELYDNEIVSQ